MPGKVIDQAPLAPTAEPTPPSDRWKGLTEPGTALAQGLDAIVDKDSRSTRVISSRAPGAPTR